MLRMLRALALCLAVAVAGAPARAETALAPNGAWTPLGVGPGYVVAPSAFPATGNLNLLQQSTSPAPNASPSSTIAAGQVGYFSGPGVVWGRASGLRQGVSDAGVLFLPVGANVGGYAASGLTPVASVFSATGSSASFTPLAGRSFNVSLWGVFSATCPLKRSFDGGSTWLPITASGLR